MPKCRGWGGGEGGKRGWGRGGAARSRGDSQGAPVSLGGRTQARTRGPAEPVWKPGRQRGEHLGINDKAAERGGRRRPTPTWGEGTVPGERRAGPGRAGRPRGLLRVGPNPPQSRHLAAVGGRRSPPGDGVRSAGSRETQGGSESRALGCLSCSKVGRTAGERWPLCTDCAGEGLAGPDDRVCPLPVSTFPQRAARGARGGLAGGLGGRGPPAGGPTGAGADRGCCGARGRLSPHCGEECRQAALASFPLGRP